MADQPLPEQLHHWVVKDMGFHPQGRYAGRSMPTEQDFVPLCKGRQMEAIWKYVIKHVKSANDVKKIQGNLTIKAREAMLGRRTDQESSEEKTDLLEKRKKLKTLIAATRQESQHLERDLEQIKADIGGKDKIYHERTEQVSDLQRKAKILEIHSATLEDENSKYAEFIQNMNSKVQQHKERAKWHLEAESYSKDEGNVNQGLETACKKNVRESCEKIGKFVQDMLQGEFNTDKGLVERRRAALWAGLGEAGGQFAAQQLIMSLSSLTQDTAHSLKDKTSSINITKDIELLKFKYENGRLMDTASEPSILLSVHQLLVESQHSYLQRYLEAEKSLNSGFSVQDRMKQAAEQMEQMLCRQYRDDPGALQMARELYNVEASIAANRAALRSMENSAEELRERICKGAAANELLYSKYQEIQDFKNVTKNNQNLIRVLAKQNANARGKIEDQKIEIHKYIQTSLSSHEADIMAFSGPQKDAVSTEIEAFAKIGLPYLLWTMLESGRKTGMMDLSIERLGRVYGSQGRTLQQLMRLLEFPPYKAPECLLPKVMELRKEIDDLEMALRSQEQVKASLEGREAEHKGIAEHLSGLCVEVRSRDNEQLETILPMLQKRLTSATQALTECLNVRDALQIWWDQPGQHTFPWMKVDSLTLQQWRDKWTVAVTRLRQVMSAS